MTDFDELYRCYVDAVFRFAVRLVRRRDIAEEITSETFVALYEHLAEIDTTQLPSWLFKVARNRATDYWRRQVLENRFLAGYKPVGTVDPVEGTDFEHWLEDNPALKPIHRVCLKLRYVYGMDRSEIAAGTGFTETQVKGLLQYARQILRRQFESAGRGRGNDASARSGR
jgi:RNA polymerase sigma-70 factor (ECF subfamily)